MRTIKLLLIFAFTFTMGVSHAQEVGDYWNDYSYSTEDEESGLIRIALLGGEKGLLANSDIAIGTILKSHHFNNKDFNETHNGIYLSIDQWSLGSYKNSGNQQSTFVTYNSEIFKKRQFEIDLVIGVADGYADWNVAQGDYLPILGFSTKWTYFKTMMSYDVVAFGLELPLN